MQKKSWIFCLLLFLKRELPQYFFAPLWRFVFGLTYRLMGLYSYKNLFVNYQLAFVTPGISPAKESSLKQIRQIANFLMYPRGLPHTRQRLYALTPNLGSLFCFSIMLVLAN